ncbi:RNA polymerase sigma factor SigF [Nocardia sp. CDC159]|uniref:RNA polymerase sigma factor SigF n=2 Tax=Nocardiaceae TaxID=85025 RepID=A0A9X2EC14_9NOCA|nr:MULTISPECIES: RNA polymerase sigma factor SigF [Nocardia]MCM6778077.1 RNA polymerase sigma factor SigF [Nocardia pulmonis]MCM6790966.1 RNA polymerase sigma factor SigF [Nocardia sp. CDC159]
MTESAGSRCDESRTSKDTYDDIEPWFDKLAGLAADDPHRGHLRDEVIERCLPLAEHIARRFAGRGESFEDLLQVARVGVVLAVDRYDVTRGANFLSFAVPTVMGEVRRYFRDNTWAVRVPRRLKEIQQLIGPTTEKLAQRLGRMPTARELAEELEVEVTEITNALVAANGYRTDSLEATVDDGEDSPTPLRDSLGSEEPCYELVEQAMAVRPLLAELPERDRRALILRYFEAKTQTQIAEELGVSQMHVSRILAKTLQTLKDQALEVSRPRQAA